jgi:hypothetical protein
LSVLEPFWLNSSLPTEGSFGNRSRYRFAISGTLRGIALKHLILELDSSAS